jgi:protein STE50
VIEHIYLIDTDGYVLLAGCLLELSRPIADISTKTSSDEPTGTKPIPHDCVISSSFPGVVLMDYAKKGEDELDLKQDDHLRVL